MQKILRLLLKFLMQGIIVVAPVAITIYLIYWLFTSIDNLIPIFTSKDSLGNIINKNYGLGVVVILSFLIIIGYLSSNFLTGKLFSLFDDLLERAPGVKFIYSSVKDFFEAFAGDKRKFTKPVLVRIRTSPELWQIGFITQDNLQKFKLENKISVYMPHSYAVSGVLVIVNKEDIKHIDVDPANAMKMAVSGGIAGYEEEEEEEEKQGLIT